jgi:hypothetical protein
VGSASNLGILRKTFDRVKRSPALTTRSRKLSELTFQRIIGRKPFPIGSIVVQIVAKSLLILINRGDIGEYALSF